MKIRTHSLITLLCAATASVVIIASPAEAGYIVTLTQVGPNVVANGSGAIDLTGWSLVDVNIASGAFLEPSVSFIVTGPTGGGTDQYGISGLSGPTSFGSGIIFFPNSGSGDLVGIWNPLSFPALLIVPHGYVSGTALSDTATYDNTTFSSLGVTPGTYEWTWGTGANQNFTLIIGATTVPDAGSTFMLLSGAIVALGSFKRCRI
jgi:hypothetical protein